MIFLNKVIAVLIPTTFFFIILFVYTKLAGPIPFSVNSVTTNKTDSFNVTGEGKVTVKPDVASVNVGIRASGSTVKGVQDQINSAINKVSSDIKALGVLEKDIQTASYSIYPTIDYTDKSQRITGYQASTSLDIKVRQLDKINTVLDAATLGGANTIGGVTFDVDDKTVYQNQARQIAVGEAKRKAQEAAKIAGFSLGKIVNYNEDFEGTPPVFAQGALTLESKDAKTQVEPGSSEIKVNVTLSYEVR